MPRKKKATDVAPQVNSNDLTPSRVLVGIDWADAEHAYAMRDPNGKLHRGTFKQTPEAIATWPTGKSSFQVLRSSSALRQSAEL